MSYYSTQNGIQSPGNFSISHTRHPNIIQYVSNYAIGAGSNNMGHVPDNASVYSVTNVIVGNESNNSFDLYNNVTGDTLNDYDLTNDIAISENTSYTTTTNSNRPLATHTRVIRGTFNAPYTTPYTSIQVTKSNNSVSLPEGFTDFAISNPWASSFNQQFTIFKNNSRGVKNNYDYRNFIYLKDLSSSLDVTATYKIEVSGGFSTFTFTVSITNSITTLHFDSSSPNFRNFYIFFPYTVPDHPIITSVIPRSQGALINFTAPQNYGGLPITHYTATSNPDNIVVTGSGSPITISGLTNGTSYTFNLSATNSFGTSLPVSSDTITPVISVPDAPNITSITGDNITATLNFTIYDGGSPITSYIVTYNGIKQTFNQSSSPIIISNFSTKTQYTFTIIAVNNIGSSLSSNSVSWTSGFVYSGGGI